MPAPRYLLLLQGTVHLASGYVTSLTNDYYFCGLSTLTVPIDFAVSGVPSPLVDFSPLSSIFSEWRVGVLERPICLPVISPGLPFCGGLAVEDYKRASVSVGLQST